MRRTLLLALAAAAAIAAVVPVALAHGDGHGRHAARDAVVVGVDDANGTITLRVSSKLLAGVKVGDHFRLEHRALRQAPGVKELDDDEVEVKGTLTSLSPVTVTTRAGRSVSCVVPAGLPLAGLSTGTFVEITCDLVGGTLTLRKIKAEDDDDADVRVDRGDDDRGDDDRGGSGSGSGRGSSGHGGDD